MFFYCLLLKIATEFLQQIVIIFQINFINIRLFFRALLIIDVNLNGPKSPLLVLVNQTGFILLKLIPLSPTTATATTI